MSAISLATEVEETEAFPRNLIIRLQGRTLAEDEDAGKKKLQLLDRVEDILEKIGTILCHNSHTLPTEVQDLGSSRGPGDLLRRLDLLVRDGTLDDFLQENLACRRLFSELFGCRYPYLKEQESAQNSNDADQGSRLGPSSSNLASKDTLFESIDAYDGFDPLYSDSASISLQELELAEKTYDNMNSLLGKKSVDKVLQSVSNMAPQLKEALTERFANLSDISQRFQEDSQKKIFAQMPPAKSEIELEMTVTQPDQEEYVDEDEAGDENSSVESGLPQNLGQRPGTSITPADLQLQPYKGWYIEGPRVQLTRAKNFLADSDIDRTVDWEHKFAELTEYFAYLHSRFQGEDWIHDLKNALDMLRTHWIFENYYYGTPQLIVDFPTGIWPTQSRRLPQLPGPEIILRAESSEKLDLTGPRRLLHVEVASAHDRQYEMPAHVLRRDYLEPYWMDSEKFWVAGPFADATEPANLAACENECYEDCMDGGMVQTARFLMSKDGFHPLQRNTGSHETLEAFARFRGGKRAALQQCLSIFTHEENRQMCTPWRVLALPKPPEETKQKPDAGIVFSTKKLANPPEKESRDPWAYTRCYQWFKKEELRWAQQMREEYSGKNSSAVQLLRPGSDGSSMELPKNWKGPVLPDLMNRDMKRAYELLRRCQKIHQGLKRAAKRAPRDFIIGLLQTVEAGLTATESAAQDMNLRFGEHEYESTNGSVLLANVRPTEAAWLEYICQPSRNRPQTLGESLGKRGELMLSRVAHMMKDISPISLFWDMKPRPMGDFLKELNLGCRGPVKRYKFTDKDVKLLAPKLHDLKILRVYTNPSNGEWMFGRPETEFHPEDLVKWPDHKPQELQHVSYTSRVVTPESQNRKHIQDDASVSSDGTCSMPVSVPVSCEDFHIYPKDMPKRKDVMSLRSFIKDPTRSPEWRERTANFFYCLGYRLGKTLRVLQRQHEENQEKSRDLETQMANAGLLSSIISRWEDDTERHANDPLKNRPDESSWRMTMTYQDVVNIADPDTYKEHQEAWTETSSQDGRPTWRDASDIVRKNLIREAYENKTMLWPLPLPYNSYVVNYKVADPTIWQKRLSEFWSSEGLESKTHRARSKALDAHIRKEMEETDKAQKMQKQNLKPTRCEPIWTFGHPSRKKAVHLFWDINNWPVHLQSESRRRVIASRGPAKRAFDHDVANDEAAAAAAAAAFADTLEEEDEMPYWKKAEQRRKFIPGRNEFWMGDTLLQQKEFENRMKKRLTPRSKKRTWGDALKTAVFGSPAKRKHDAISDADLDLSSLPLSQIPQSRPTKRRCTRSLLPERGEQGEHDLFVVVGGEKGIRERPNTVPIHARNTSLDMGKVTYYIPETKIRGEGVGDGYMMEVDEPKIEYGLPTKRL
ncbi:hypothetical protein ACHAQJ_010204 [Trichoderma viride]